MRILYLHPKSWTGEYPILGALRRLGHEVFALEEKAGSWSERRRLSDHYRDPGDGIGTLWYDPHRGWERLLTWAPDRIFRRAFGGRNLVHRMWVIGEAVRRFRPDVVVCSDGFSYAVPAGCMRRLGMLDPKLVISYIGGDILDDEEAEMGRRRGTLVDWLLRQSYVAADVLRPVSPMLAEVLLRDGVPRERVRVCPSHLVVSGDTLAAVRERRGAVRAEVRQRHSLPDDARVIVTLSMNQKGKGLHVLARAWPEVVRRVAGARWLLCGPSHPWLDAAVWPVLREAGVAGSVVATGPLSGAAVFEHLAAADLNVNPTLCEGLNMVTVEAAAVGTPTVTSDGAGVADWVMRHKAGTVVPRGDAGALADAIIRAFHNPDVLQRWSAAAPAMSSEFSLDRVATMLVALMTGGPVNPSPPQGRNA